MAATTRSRVTIVEFTSKVKDERATRCEAEEANNEVLFINNNIANQVTSSAEVYREVVNHRNPTIVEGKVTSDLLDDGKKEDEVYFCLRQAL